MGASASVGSKHASPSVLVCETKGATEMKIERNGVEMIKCEECDEVSAIPVAGKRGWDWFTGFLPRTHHYCPKHNASQQHNATFKHSRIRQERAK